MDRRNKVLTALVVALFFTWPVAGQEPCASGSSDQCEGPLKEIGTAMFMRRGEPSQYVRGRKFLSHTHEVMPHRIQLENLGLENLSPKASMRRKMLQSQCSTTDNSNEAVRNFPTLVEILNKQANSCFNYGSIELCWNLKGIRRVHVMDG